MRSRGWKNHGIAIHPDVMGQINHALQDLSIDIVDAMHRSGLDGAEKLIVEHETKIVPELAEKCRLIQHRYMAEVAAHNQKIVHEKLLTGVKHLGPARALKELENVPLRLVDDDLEAAGTRDANRSPADDRRDLPPDDHPDPQGPDHVPEGVTMYKIHPAAETFPMLEDFELELLANDISANGL
jgi:hypothetical protein